VYNRAVTAHASGSASPCGVRLCGDDRRATSRRAGSWARLAVVAPVPVPVRYDSDS